MPRTLRVLAVGDVVGPPGIRTLEAVLPRLKTREEIDFVVVNGENGANNGTGLAARGARRIFTAGADVITLGDHWFRKADLMPLLGDNPKLLRPANYPPEAVGGGVGRYACGELQVGVMAVQGRIFMEPVDCPFHAADAAIESLSGCDVILVDFHAEATSESIAMGHHLDGRVGAVWGTHTHVQTADEQILPGGTAFLCDLGMTGPHDGVIGRQVAPVLQKMSTAMPAPFKIATGDLRLMGAIIDIDVDAKKATAIRRVREQHEPDQK